MGGEIAMEWQNAKQKADKLEKDNPKDIAGELIEHGMNDSWLYPEMPIVSSEIERHKVYY